MTEQEVWDLVVAHEHTLKKEICRYLPRARRSELDEAFSDCCTSRAHSIMATYRPERGVLPITHLAANVRWYAYKAYGPKKYWHYKRIPDSTPTENLVRHAARTLSAEHSVEVALLLESLPEDAANVLRWVTMSELTYAEIAAHQGLTTAQVKTRFHEALELAKELFREPGDPTEESLRERGSAPVHGDGDRDEDRAQVSAACAS